MKNDFKFSSKMHLFIMISCIIIALGVAVGVICQFAAGGYFNYGADWSDYKSVTVSYEYVDFSDRSDVEEICESAFSSAGISSYISTWGETSTGGVLVYKFTLGTDDGKLDSACSAIQSAIKVKVSSDICLSGASDHTDTALLGGGKSLMMGGIALASVVAFEFLYFLIRYKVSMALGALLANAHNLALFLSVLSLTRIPVGTSVFAFAVLTVVLTMIGCCFLFGKMRRNFKDEDLSKLGAEELVDRTASETFLLNVNMSAVMAVVAVLMFILLTISSFSPLAIISPVLCALVSFIVCAYGTQVFTPAVYSRFKVIGDDLKNKTRPSAKKAEQSK